jgi:hypothetical protein
MIFITGDTHGMYDIEKLNLFNSNLVRDTSNFNCNSLDYMIIVGDAGIIWYNDYRDEYHIKAYENFPWTTLFIDGNHENHAALAKYPVEEWHGGLVHRISPKILHLMRGQVYTIEEKTFFTMGGADSVDKMYRVKGQSWWAEELPSAAELDTGIKNLEKYDFKVDYVLTHCCGDKYLPQLYYTSHINRDSLTSYFNHLEDDFHLQYKMWYFGHHHLDKILDDNKHMCLYQNIIEV